MYILLFFSLYPNSEFGDVDDVISIQSTHTLTNETFNDSAKPCSTIDPASLSDEHRHDADAEENDDSSSPTSSAFTSSPPRSNAIHLPQTPLPVRRIVRTRNSKKTDDCSSGGGGTIETGNQEIMKSNIKHRRGNVASRKLSTGCSSPAIKSMSGTDVSPVREEDDTETDTDSLMQRVRRMKKLNVS